ncbi:nitroreductase family deazaflavin-dependent oxidoreductase [Pseudonocardia sp. CA-107938]|uniref:nitroreductase family deazaflavin-dependent oxidoreductase n=1 Tax=Pseudonocardia sp. CA-107938 TaxID=3240021 RepID=UPI003D8E7656
MTDPRRSIRPPAWIKSMNEGLARDGVPLDVLTVPGRTSGRPRSTPLTVAELDGHRYVLGGFPAADWIKNVRAAGTGTLALHTGTSEEVRLVEVDDAEAETVLRAWPEVTPDGVAMMVDAGVVTGATPDAMAEAVGICPVFRVEGTA